MGNQRPMEEIMYTTESYNEKLSQIFPESEFEIIKFQGVKNPFSFKCLVCGTIHNYTQADKVNDRYRRGLKNICYVCEDTRQLGPRLKGIQKIKQISIKKNIFPLEEIKRLEGVKIKWLCKKCNHTFEKTPNQFIAHNQCPWCESHFSSFTEEIIKKKILLAHGTEYDLIAMVSTGRIKVRHNECGFIFNTSTYNFIRGHGCPRCKSSLGEKKVRKYLKENGFYFQEQYQFKNSSISTLYFDFYLEENGQQIVIEYQGRQHYEVIDHFGGEKSFKEQQERDDRKRQFCKKNNILLIEIPYNDESCLHSNELAQRLRGQALER